MNREQQGSAVKYFYDLSKGCLLAGLVGVMSGQIHVGGFAFFFSIAGYAYLIAYQLED